MEIPVVKHVSEFDVNIDLIKERIIKKSPNYTMLIPMYKLSPYLSTNKPNALLI